MKVIKVFTLISLNEQTKELNKKRYMELLEGKFLSYIVLYRFERKLFKIIYL